MRYAAAYVTVKFEERGVCVNLDGWSVYDCTGRRFATDTLSGFISAQRLTEDLNKSELDRGAKPVP